MFRYLRFYAGPAAGIAIAGGLFFGGVWLWIPGFIYLFGIAGLDQFFKHDLDEEPYKFRFLLDIPLYLSLPVAMMMFFGLFWVAGSDIQDVFGVGALIQQTTGLDVVAMRNDTGWYHYVLMVIALILPLTAAGGLAGHELTHRTSKPFDLWLGRTAMALNWGFAFPIEHVYGHHSYVGTKRDPATAARGDSLYQHLPKAMYRTIKNAWALEAERLEKIDASLFSFKNVVLRMMLVSIATTAFAFYCAGWLGVMFHLVLCLGAKIALEVLNYVEHYGIIREADNPVQPRHSWNCNHVVSGIMTYNLTRHSHHHADAQAPYHELKAHAEQPEMPGGLMKAYLTTLVPPLWRKTIAPCLIEWDATQANTSEYDLINQANVNSGWPELLQSVASQQGIAGH